MGRPPKLYATVLQLLSDVYEGSVLAEDLLAEVVRCLLLVRNEKRQRFVEAYQALLLAEPESAVSQPLKEAFLALRQAAESGSS